MSQSKRHSALEVLLSTAIGYIASVTAQVLVFPLYGINVSLLENMSLVLMFTFISVIRGYWVRRLFNWIGNRRSA